MVLENSIVLLHETRDERTFSCYARVEEILADVKPGWYNVRFKILIPGYDDVTWTLKEEYLNGEEFTMGGNPVKIEEVPPAKVPDYVDKQGNKKEEIKEDKKETKEDKTENKVIDFEEYRKNKMTENNNIA